MRPGVRQPIVFKITDLISQNFEEYINIMKIEGFERKFKACVIFFSYIIE